MLSQIIRITALLAVVLGVILCLRIPFLQRHKKLKLLFIPISIITFLAIAWPIENFFYSFSSPEKAFQYSKDVYKRQFSIYAKTTNVTPGTGKGGVFIGAPQFTGENEQGLIKNEGMTVLTGTTDRSVNNGWSRLQLTFTVAADNTYVMVRAGLQNASGTVLLDCAQLEQGDTANKFNLIQNSSFANGNNWVVESHITCLLYTSRCV